MQIRIDEKKRAKLNLVIPREKIVRASICINTVVMVLSNIISKFTHNNKVHFVLIFPLIISFVLIILAETKYKNK